MSYLGDAIPAIGLMVQDKKFQFFFRLVAVAYSLFGGNKIVKKRKGMGDMKNTELLCGIGLHRWDDS